MNTFAPSPSTTPTPSSSLSSMSSPAQRPKVAIDDFIRYLLTSSANTSCALIAKVYDEIVPYEKHFQVALDVVLPCLTSGNNNSVHIAAVYVLYILYAPYHIELNPFHSTLSDLFTAEQAKLKGDSSPDSADPQNGNIKFVWALWKVLRNQGSDLGNLTPLQIASEPISAENRALCLAASRGLAVEPEVVPPASSSSDQDLSSTNGSDGYTASMSIGSSDSFVDFVSGNSNSTGSAQYDHEEALSRAVFLLMTARSRVLSLSEQKSLKPFLATLASPLPVLKAPDLPELISHNPTIAHTLYVCLLAAHRPQWPEFLDVLNSLPPTLASFEFVGRLLQDPTPVAADEASKIAIADLVRTEGLGAFLHSCVDWIDRKERAATEVDGSVEKAAIDLCRFYSNLASKSLVDPSSDIESAEMAQFVLQHSKLEEATALYRLFTVSVY